MQVFSLNYTYQKKMAIPQEMAVFRPYRRTKMDGDHGKLN